MSSAYCILLIVTPQVIGLVIDTKLDLPAPSAFSIQSDNKPLALDSSLSPKIVKAFYEINFIQVPNPDPNKSHITITDPKGCPYSKDLCKYYFAPTKVSIVQKVEDLIEDTKKNVDVPVIQGLKVTDEEKLLKELSPTIKTLLNNKGKNIDGGEVPVYRGTVNVEQVLNRPEVSTLPDYRPRYPEIKGRQCFQGACWVYHS